jgi:hypothetical protein
MGQTPQEMVTVLIRDRLATEPHTARLAVTDARFAAALTWMRTTLEAVVSYAQTDGWRDAETAAVVRGALARLVRDDLLVDEELLERMTKGQVW